MTASTRKQHAARTLIGAAVALTVLTTGTAWAQKYPITAGQRATANQVAQAGVPLSELSPSAPDEYKVKRGDTLWDISKVFLKSPWRWPELWGMNLDDIKNPHLIYPGQMLYLVRDGDRARLTTRKGGTIKVSPRVRTESLKESAIPPVNLQAIQTFLDEPLIVDEGTFAKAPRIVATEEKRVLLSQGDRAYARSGYGQEVSGEEHPLLIGNGLPRDYRVFRNAVPLKDPETGEVLGYEAQYVGKAHLVRPESSEKAPVDPDKPTGDDVYESNYEKTSHNVERTQLPDAKKDKKDDILVPATIDILHAKEEMRTGDRLLPEPDRDFSTYVPSAPDPEMKGQIVSVYGNGVTYAGQNNVVAINRGTKDGIRQGHVFSLLRDRKMIVDKTDEARPDMQLPGELNGLMMVFLTFDRVSYALLLETSDTVEVGDHFVAP
ncbi:LysM domain-containing protein [Hydrogenophaga sp. 5NK40-0174]|uniref:LysM peptidoglycan-binding domain-containing protein n=1 Tax=Hydrogenophaga sp. 5NK40-0174 TaxID=3127649 RepID=UPI00310BF323